MRVCVVTSHTPEIMVVAKKTAINKSIYCLRHGYNLNIFSGRLSVRHPSWDKIAMVRNLLPLFDWCVWMDSDCIFNNFAKKLEDRLSGDAVFVRDFASDDTNRDKQLINAGVFGIRNCKDSMDFLESVWDEGSDSHSTIDKRSYVGWPWEQSALCKHILNHKNFSILDDMDMNCHPSIATPETHVIHYMGWRATQEAEDAAIADIDRRNLVLL